MKVLIVIDSLNEAIGGPSVSVPALADAVADLGTSVTVLTNDYAGLGPLASLRSARLVALPARRMPFRLGAWSPGFSAAAKREIFLCDIVHIQGLWLPTTLRAASFTRQLKKPLIISPRGMLEPWSLGHRAFRKRVIWNLAEKHNLQSAHGFHATSTAEATGIRATGFSQPAAVIPNGVATPSMIPSREIVESQHPELKNKRWLLFLSRLDEKKGLDLLLSCWAKLHAQFPQWQLIVAGGDMDGESGRYLKMAHSLEISARTTFTGSVSGEFKNCLLGQSDLLILPSHSENFGNVIVEALAAGTPAIATREMPWQELSSHQCGWWIPCETSAIFSALHEAMRQDSATLRSMGERGRVLVSGKYTWPAVASQMQGFYDWILAGSTHPAPEFLMQ